MYIILDHTKTVMITIIDGSLSSNVSGGGRVRNILRRVFAVLQKNDWLEEIGEMKDLLELFEYHNWKTFLENLKNTRALMKLFRLNMIDGAILMKLCKLTCRKRRTNCLLMIEICACVLTEFQQIQSLKLIA
ncbi:unnamed protein product [Moneuplotes crassus]|uniref:Uncharacterized protein n=1 Tax=Euplotes crassus TaxID=5936 RepID=A0AAD1XY76_EUPCR|nr:unnamed protein product [Moneuplotes crassus]